MQEQVELAEVEQELADVESELEVLLLRQSELLERKRELLVQIEASGTEHAQGSSTSHETPAEQDWKQEFPWTDRIRTLLQEQFHLPSFRSVQEEVINATLSKRDLFVVMRSGGGKSLCYQLPALYAENAGFTLVISPLISLIQDQVMLFNEIAGDGAARQLTGDQSRSDASAIYKELLDSDSSVKILLVTPEKVIKSKLLMSRLEKAYHTDRLLRIVIDEAHCCSQWGHDFRSDYSKLGVLKRQFSTVPILALTATATPRLVADVKSILEIEKCTTFRTSFFRSNLHYEVQEKPDNDAAAMDTLTELIKTFKPSDTGIVYCLTRKETEQVAAELRKHQIRAACYHAYMEDKEETHMGWFRNRLQVVVATIAFGLGINKPDVRFVIHFTLSKSMEGYYQESGRAGRDGNPARCILMYKPADVIRVCNIVHAETGGMRNLRWMIQYCEEFSKCRHAIMASFFGETFDALAMCHQGCDNCLASKRTSELQDFAEHAKALVSITADAKRLERRVTLKQLIDEFKSRKFVQQWGHLNPPIPTLTRPACERLVINMLTRDLLQPDISYTPYNTICYLVEGPHFQSFTRHGKELRLQLSIHNNGEETVNAAPPPKKRRRGPPVIELLDDSDSD